MENLKELSNSDLSRKISELIAAKQMETDEYRAIQAEFALREIESSTKQKDYALLELLNKKIRNINQ